MAIDDGWSRRHTWLLLGLLALAAGLASAGALWEGPWEDEYYSLRGVDNIRGYSLMPVYFVWLKVGHSISSDFHWLRIWSFAPWLVGLWLARRLLMHLGARPWEALATIALLAANPFLLHECMRVRYYAFFFLAAVLAIRALLFLLDGRGSRLGSVVACVLLLLPQLTVYSGVALLLTLCAYWISQRGLPLRSIPVVGTLAAIAIGLAGYKLASNLQFLFHVDIERVIKSLPINLGYEKAPPTAWALAYQYNKILGWNYPSWFISPHLVELCSGVIAAAIAATFWQARRRCRGLVLSLALVPVLVWIAALAVNAIGVRYYLYASLPLAYMSVVALGVWWRRIRQPIIRCLPPAAFVICCAGSLALSFAIPTTPDLDDLERVIRRHEVRTMTVSPVWLAAPLKRLFADRGLPTQIVGWGTTEAPPTPQWVFRKYPRYTWTLRKQHDQLDLADYRIVRRLQSLKKYYFHPGRVTDLLLRRREK